MERDLEIKTMSVPAAGKQYFGLSRNGSYAAASRGELPTIRIGKLLRVPIVACERMLESVGEGHDIGGSHTCRSGQKGEAA